MNLNEIITKIYHAAELLDSEALIAESNSLQKAAEQLTPRSMDQKPEHEQWCLVFDQDGDSFIARYNAGLNSFHDDYWVRSSESYKWLPAPKWKEEE